MKKEILIKSFAEEANQFSKGNTKRKPKQKGSKEEKSNYSYECPIHCLPYPLPGIIEEIHEVYKLPKDYYFLSTLIAAGGIMGNQFSLELRPGQTYPSLIYGALVGSSSIGKSPAMNFCLRPLQEIENKNMVQFKVELKNWYSKMKEGNTTDDKPKAKELILKNATLEAVYQVFENNPNGLIMIKDEIMGWLDNMNRYNGGNDEQTWIEIWNNPILKKNRATQDLIYKENMFVALIGGLQPGLLQKFGSKNRKDSGLLPRFLFAFPVDQTKSHDLDKSIDILIIDEYKAVMDRIQMMMTHYKEVMDIGEQKIITLSSEARPPIL